MNGRVTSLEHAGQFESILPEGYVKDVQKRRQTIAVNKEITLKNVELIDENCDQLSGSFKKLQQSFTQKRESFTRLESASRNNFSAHVDLNDTLRTLASQLREGAEKIRKHYAV